MKIISLFDSQKLELQDQTIGFLCQPPFYFPELLFITEGKYWNQLKKFRKFRDVLSSGSHETGSTAKKVTASDSTKPGLKKFFPQNHPRPQKIQKKRLSTHFFANFSLVMIT